MATTTVEFEVAALADAVRKAAAVAPTRGVSFQKASGIVLDVSADEVVVKATDTVTQIATWITPESFEGNPSSWRLPSKVFSEVLGKLKTTMNKTLTLSQDGGTLRLTHGRSTRASFMMIDLDGYPDWAPFSPDDMKLAEGIAGAAASVQWAVSKGTEVPYTGVHFSGSQVIATDKYRFAVRDCPIDLSEPITVPPTALTSVLKSTDSVLVRVDGSRLYMMPDEFTQISTSVYGLPFPSKAIQALMSRKYDYKVRVNKRDFADMIDLVCSMIQGDRQPTLILIFGRQEVAAMLSNVQTGLLGNIIETPGQLEFNERHEVRFKPEYLTGALEGCTASEIVLQYNPTDSRIPFHIDGGDVKYWLAPRQKTVEVEE